ncbi:MAG: threonine synthase, partial [Eubacteriales bacterium]|nr:threonine synthase [Eubacteriales bacterium]
SAGFADVERTAQRIRTVLETENYLMDPHTAVADAVYADYRQMSGDKRMTVIASTASPYKFPNTVTGAPAGRDGDDFALFETIQSMSGRPVPDAVRDLSTRPILHDTVIDTADIAETVVRLLHINA